MNKVQGDLTRQGFEKKRFRLLSPYIALVEPQWTQREQLGVSQWLPRFNPAARALHRVQPCVPGNPDALSEWMRVPVPCLAQMPYAVPMPSKRHSLLAQMSVETYTPPDTSSTSEDDGSLRRIARASPTSPSNLLLAPGDSWATRPLRCSSTSSSASSEGPGPSECIASLSTHISSCHRPRTPPYHALPSFSPSLSSAAISPSHTSPFSPSFGHDHAASCTSQSALSPSHSVLSLPYSALSPPHHHHYSPTRHYQQQAISFPSQPPSVHPPCSTSDNPSGSSPTHSMLSLSRESLHKRRPLAESERSATGSASSLVSLTESLEHSRLESRIPPDVMGGTVGERSKRSHAASVRGLPVSHLLGNPELMDTADGVPVNGRVSAKIQQLLETLRMPRRPPLKEFFVDDFEELLEAPQVDPNHPVPQGSESCVTRGEPLTVLENSPTSLEGALQRWGVTASKMACLTSLDPYGKPAGTLTYGKLWGRSVRLAYTLLHRLGTKHQPLIKPGDRVALVYPNSEPITFALSFYACLLAGLVPVPIEVPISRKDPWSQQLGFLLGSCSVAVALTSEACHRGLPKSSTGEVVQFKGWPKIIWHMTDAKSLPKAPKEWTPFICEADLDTAYIEYKTGEDGSVVGVTVTRRAVLAHCRALTQACSYIEGETMVNVLDFKKDVGLWHGILTSVLNMLHVVFVPYALMKVNPSSWLQKIYLYKASTACVKSRDMHWAMVALQEQLELDQDKELDLSSLRLILIADGANPWSFSSCDAFMTTFQSRGLRPDCLCPCAASPEGLTVALRRPLEDSVVTSGGQFSLSLHDLSHRVVCTNAAPGQAQINLQDLGSPLPGSLLCVVRPDGAAQLCREDEVGEICVFSDVAGLSYYGLPGLTKGTFEVFPLTESGMPACDRPFVRSGLLGFISNGSLVHVVARTEGTVEVGGRRHSVDDIIATVLAMEPAKFVFHGRLSVFSVTVLHDQRLVVVAEQKAEVSEEDSFAWMTRTLQVFQFPTSPRLIYCSFFSFFLLLFLSSMSDLIISFPWFFFLFTKQFLQVVDSIHQVGLYCIALLPSNGLPRSLMGGVSAPEARRRFLEGTLHPCNLLMCPYSSINNLPKPRQRQPVEIGPASVMLGNLVAGKRVAQASGRDLGHLDDDPNKKSLYLSDILQWRSQTTPDHMLFLLLNGRGGVAGSATCAQLQRRAERVAAVLAERSAPHPGDHVALLFPPGINLIVAFYGCLYIGCVPITVRPPHPQHVSSMLPTVHMVIQVSQAVCVLTTASINKLLRRHEGGDKHEWPPIIDTDDLPKKRPCQICMPTGPDALAYLDYSVSTKGTLTGVKMTHGATGALCRAIKLQCELYPSRDVVLCLDPYCGLGFVLWCLTSVYCGHQSILVPPVELETDPALWLSAVSQHRVRDTFCSYSAMELCTRDLGAHTDILRSRGVELSRVRTCAVLAEERPRIPLTHSFTKLFRDLGLSARAVSAAFSCRVNPAVCLQGTAGPDPTTVYVDLRALWHDRVRIVEKGVPHSVPLMESGKILPGVRVIIASPEHHGPLGDSDLGEIWVQSVHNASGYFSVHGEPAPCDDHFCARLSFGDTQSVWARTGYLGFLRRTHLTDASGEPHDALYIVGALEETLDLRGLRYHPIDIETSVLRAHKSIAECAVFTWTNLLVVVVELDGSEQQALDLVPQVTTAVLEEHYLVVGVVVVVDLGVIPVNSRGEKQRLHLRDGFFADRLDPIFVAYNM
uniref:Uncharacterized protein n=1 Tax=Eptatretus burgeri TaxID=7764 RepID=A0A8C4QJ99_EPTBU